MSEDIVKIKGSRSGLQLVWDAKADFSAVEKDVKEKLESGSNFFCRGTVIEILPERLAGDEQERLTKLFRQHGVLLRMAEHHAAEQKPDLPEKPVHAEEPKSGHLQEMLVVDRTVRGGQEIVTPGAVLICGNVNPGAQIIAGGSIDIRGTCRGTVHAGAYGNTHAFVIADHLMPVQIRIADLIAQAPEQMEKPACAERASIKDGQIIIEPIER